MFNIPLYLIHSEKIDMASGDFPWQTNPFELQEIVNLIHHISTIDFPITSDSPMIFQSKTNPLISSRELQEIVNIIHHLAWLYMVVI